MYAFIFIILSICSENDSSTHLCVILFWQKQNESTPVRLNDICNACLSRSDFTEIRKGLSGNNYIGCKCVLSAI